MQLKTFRTAAALIAIVAAAPLVAQTARPAAQGTAARPAGQPQAQQPQTVVNNVPTLCRVREQEIIGLNRALAERNQVLQAEKDQAKRQPIIQQMQNLQANLRETESSWQRMSCVSLLYNVRAQ